MLNIALNNQHLINPKVLNLNKPTHITLQAETYFSERMDEIVELSKQYKTICIQGACGQGKTTLINKLGKQFPQFALINSLKLPKEQNEEALIKVGIQFSTDIRQPNINYSLTQHNVVSYGNMLQTNLNTLFNDESHWFLNYSFLSETNHPLKMLQFTNQYIAAEKNVFFISATQSVFREYGHLLGVECFVDFEFKNQLVYPKTINLYKGNSDIDIKQIIYNEILTYKEKGQIYVCIDVGKQQQELNLTTSDNLNTLQHFGHQGFQYTSVLINAIENWCKKENISTLTITSQTTDQPEVKQTLDELKTQERLTNKPQVVLTSTKMESGFNIKSHNAALIIVVSHDADFIQQAYSRFRTQNVPLTLIYNLKDKLLLPSFSKWDILQAVFQSKIIDNTFYPINILYNLNKLQSYTNFYKGEHYWKTVFPKAQFNFKPEKFLIAPRKLQQFFNGAVPETNLQNLYSGLKNIKSQEQFRILLSKYDIVEYNGQTQFVLQTYYDANRNKKIKTKTAFGYDFDSMDYSIFETLYTNYIVQQMANMFKTTNPLSKWNNFNK